MGAPKSYPDLKPDIFTYHDYRAFMRDWMSYSKTHFGISLRQFAIDSGLSPSFISMLVAGNRKLSHKAIQKLVPIFEFNEIQKEYFLLLQTLGDSESHTERMQTLSKIQKIASYKKLNPKELEAYKYLSHWYYVAIREMVGMADFKLEADWIQKRLNYFVSIPEINAAIDFLIEYKFIEQLPDGGAKLPEKRIACFEGVYKIALSNFYKEMFQLASDSIEEIPRAKRSLAFETMAISSEKFDEVSSILEEARKKIELLGHSQTKSDCVYHVSFAAFPLAESGTKKDEVL